MGIPRETTLYNGSRISDEKQWEIRESDSLCCDSLQPDSLIQKGYWYVRNCEWILLKIRRWLGFGQYKWFCMYPTDPGNQNCIPYCLIVRFSCNILRVRGPSLIENGQKTSFDNDEDRLHQKSCRCDWVFSFRLKGVTRHHRQSCSYLLELRKNSDWIICWSYIHTECPSQMPPHLPLPAAAGLKYMTSISFNSEGCLLVAALAGEWAT